MCPGEVHDHEKNCLREYEEKQHKFQPSVDSRRDRGGQVAILAVVAFGPLGPPGVSEARTFKGITGVGVVIVATVVAFGPADLLGASTP